jgi:hypothetical protein
MDQGYYPLPSSPGGGGPRTPQAGGVPQRSARTYDINPAPVHRAYPPASVSFRDDSDWDPDTTTDPEDYDIGDGPPDTADTPDNIVAGDIDADAVGDGDGPHDVDAVDTSDGCDDCADAGDTADNIVT